MVFHTLLSVYRSFKRDKSTFFINFAGLSTGLACSLFIYLWVVDELHVDKFNKNDNQLFQVLKNAPSASGISTTAQTPSLLAQALAREIPEVELAVSVTPPEWFSDEGVLAFHATRVKADGQFVSRDYFKLFTFEFLEGSAEKALSDKYGIILTGDVAQKLFGETHDVVGRAVAWKHENLSGDFVVAGVVRQLPVNSSLQADVLFNYDLFLEKNKKGESWLDNDPNTFVKLRQGTDIDQFNNKIAGFIKNKNEKATVTLFAQRFSDRYLHNQFENGVPSGGRIGHVKLFLLIAFFILFNACINFMNLSTAKALRRSKEVGIKKVVGARRRTLILQFLGESMMLSFLSLSAAIVGMFLLLPSFNEMTGKQLSISFDWMLIAGAVAITFLTGLVSGSYPSLYLSGFSPAAVLKGRLRSSFGELWTRKSLVLFQSAVSIVLIVSALVVYKQIELVNTKNLGYNRDHIIYFEKGDSDGFNDPKAFEADLERFIQDVKNIPGVLNATNFRHSITNRDGGTTAVEWEGKSPEESISFTDLAGGYDLIETLGIKMKEGRTFSRDFESDKSSVIVNEKAVAAMGLKDPVGKTITIWGSDRKIIGVTRDFHFQSLYEEIRPLFFDFSLNKRVSRIMVKIGSGGGKETVDRIREVYSAHNPGLAFDYSFLDSEYQSLYESETRVAGLSKYFTVIAMVISCLGLLGLAAFAAEKRRKEIGIRKILGANEIGIVQLLTGDFTRIIALSIAIALPISYYLTKNWLDNFVYRIDLSVWYFVGAGCATLLVSWLVVAIQTIKAATMNPVKSLRAE